VEKVALEARRPLLEKGLDALAVVVRGRRQHPLIEIHVHDGAIERRGHGIDALLDHLSRDGRLGRVLVGHRARASKQLVGPGDLVVERPVEQRLRILFLPEHDHALGACRANQVDAEREGDPLQVHTAVDLGVAAEGVAGTDPKVAGGGNAGPAAERAAIHRRDRNLIDLVNRAHEIRAGAQASPQLEPRRRQVAPGCVVLEVGAGAEVSARAGEDHDTGLRIVRKGVRGVDQLEHQVAAERVQALGTVERQGGDVAVLRDLDVLVRHRAQTICQRTTVAAPCMSFSRCTRPSASSLIRCEATDCPAAVCRFVGYAA